MGTRRFSPGRVAAVYAAAGVAWILTTDTAVAVVVDRSLVAEWPQTAKGLVFVALSSVLIYELVRLSTDELEAARAELDRANYERTIYDRILRHNFRNGVQAVSGNLDLAKSATGAERDARLHDAATAADRLADLITDARQFSSLIALDPEPQSVDLPTKVREGTTVIEEFPGATLELDVPESLSAAAVADIDVAFEHLIENACEHAGASPTVTCSVHERDGRAAAVVSDDGPGVPASERAALAVSEETPLAHTSGLGLRIAQWLVDRSDGDLRFEDDGSTVITSFPTNRNP